jgi:CheY-like chemotaxis protein
VRVLLVDDEVDLVEIMEFLVQSVFPSVSFVQKAFSGNEAIAYLKKESFDICICDHNMPNGMGNEVLKYIVESSLKTKFVLCSTVTPAEKPQDYPIAQIFSNIQKPEISAGLEKIKNLLSEEMSAKNLKVHEFYPISISLLELMGTNPADIYIKISDSHFVKVLKCNESFTSVDKIKFSSKPVQILYIKKGENKANVDAKIEEALKKLFEHKEIPLTDKLSISHSQLVGMIKFTGISPELAELTKNNILQSAEYIKRVPAVADFWKGLTLMGDYPSRLYTLHSMLASIVLKKTVWNSESLMFKLTLSAFLQDITLDSIALMELFDYQEFLVNESRFSRAEVKRYLEHSQRAVELLTAFKDLPADIMKIVLEQHEMPNGDGFPKKLNSIQINPLSCLFILTGIMARFVLRDGDEFDLREFVSVMDSKGYGKGNFKEPFEAIKKLSKTAPALN